MDNDGPPNGSSETHSPEMGLDTWLYTGLKCEGACSTCKEGGLQHSEGGRIYSLLCGTLRQLKKSEAPQCLAARDCNSLRLASCPW